MTSGDSHYSLALPGCTGETPTSPEHWGYSGAKTYLPLDGAISWLDLERISPNNKQL